MKLLFVEGDKGIVATYNGKFCFPDRTSNIKEVGLYECEIVRDKDNYCFVEGSKIDTYEPTQGFVNNLIIQTHVEDGYFNSIDRFYIKQVGNSIIVILDKKPFMEFGYFNGTGFEIAFTLRKFNNTLNRYDSDRLYNIRVMKDWDSLNMAIDTALQESFDKITNDNMYEAISKAFCDLPFSSSSSITEIGIVDDRYIIFKEYLKYTNSDYIRAYAYHKNYGAVDVTNIIEDKVDKPFSKVDISDLYNWMIENHVGKLGSLTSRVEGTPLLKKTICVFNTSIDVVFYDGCLYCESCRYEYDAVVKKSFDDLEAFRKKVGKNISKSNIKELVKLSPKNVLNLVV